MLSSDETDQTDQANQTPQTDQVPASTGASLTPTQRGFIQRLKLGVSQNQSLEFIPDWIETNTSHPTNSAVGWSFKDHEFQIDILKSSSHRQSIVKCSQAGLSEVSARKALALACLRQGIQVIYTLPTGSFAQMFSKTRVDPIIDNSPVLQGMVDSDTNNTKLKRIGSSFIHFLGTYSSSSAISVPASYIISDEVDFSDQSVLTEFNSRLGHQKISESFNIQFSTPTVAGYGISANYEKSSKGRYAVQCSGCKHWQTPNFLEDVVIPNNVLPIDQLTRYDVAAMDPTDVANSYLACPECEHDLTTDLLDKDRRKWIHQFPERRADHEGFKVVPFDVPSVNPVGRTIAQMLEYSRLSSWYNYKLGENYADDTTKFNIEVVRQNTAVVDLENIRGAVVGVDVGKISWVAVGVPEHNNLTGDVEMLKVVELIRVDTTKLAAGESLGQQVVAIAKKHQAQVIVVDAAPDFTTAQHVFKLFPTGKAYGNYYVNDSVFAKSMTHYKVDDTKGVCLSARTSSLDDLCELVNSGRVTFPSGDNMKDVENHLDSLKRVGGKDGDVSAWVTRDKADDHWAHALNYLLLAAHISEGTGYTEVFSMVPKISAIAFKGGKVMDFSK